MPIKFLSSNNQVKGCTSIQAEPTEVNFGALILHVYNKGTNMLNNNIIWRKIYWPWSWKGVPYSHNGCFVRTVVQIYPIFVSC